MDFIRAYDVDRDEIPSINGSNSCIPLVSAGPKRSSMY